MSDDANLDYIIGVCEQAIVAAQGGDAGAALEPEALAAFRDLRQVNLAAFARARAKLKAKVNMGDFNRAMRDLDADDDLPPRGGASQIVALATESTADFFHHQDRGFVGIGVAGHTEVLPIRSRRGRLWLRRLAHNAGMDVVTGEVIATACEALEANAIFGGEAETVSKRIAPTDDGIAIDLGTDDWTAAVVTSASWSVVSHPVRFIRPDGMCALPVPVRGGDLDTLRVLLGLTSTEHENTWMLLIAWVLMALRPHGPYPVLIFTSQQGSGKTTASRFLRRLIDPNRADLRAEPREVRDLVIAANNGWVIALDNLSHVSPTLSDALCRLSTGSGFSTRKLYADDEEVLFEAMRPVMLNGIEELATRGDLADRALVINLPGLGHDRKRREEAELLADFDRVAAGVLGCLLDALSGALRHLPAVHLDDPPRMADFARFGAAVGMALGWPDGAFQEAYAGARQELTAATLESSVVAPAVIDMMDTGKRLLWSGTAQELLVLLNEASADRPQHWPRSATAMGNALRRVEPALRSVGLGVERSREGKAGRRSITIRRLPRSDAERPEETG